MVPSRASAASGALQLAQLETDDEGALMLFDDAVAAEPSSALALGGRGLCHLRLLDFQSAERDLGRALEALGAGSGAATGDRRADGALRALWIDSMGLAMLSQGARAGEARLAFERALVTAAAAGAATADVPDAAPLSGLRGGPPTLAQRCAFHSALALWEQKGAAAAVEALLALDDGPAPDGSPPQFWEARAARAAALYASGSGEAAEREFAELCAKTPPPPPSTPNFFVAAQVNRTAQALLEVERATTNMECTDFETGVFLPCDDAGSVVGTGGSDSPCVVFTPQEVGARLWPAVAVDALREFRERAPEESAADRARAAMKGRL